MKDRYSKLYIVILVCVLIAVVSAAATVFASLASGVEVNAVTSKSEKIDFSSHWRNENDVYVNINSYTIKSEQLYTDRPTVFTKEIPETKNSDSLYIHTRNAVVNVYIDDTALHITSPDGNSKELTEFENFIFIDMPNDSSGKEIRLEVFRTRASNGLYIDEVVLGSGSMIMRNVMSSSVISIVMGVLFIVLGVVFLLFGIFTRKKLESGICTLYFSVFLLIMAAAMIFDTPLAEISFNSPVFTGKSFRILLIAAVPAFIAFLDRFLETEHFLPLKILSIVASLMVPLFSVFDSFDILNYDIIGVIWRAFLPVCCVTVTVETALFFWRCRGSITIYKKVSYIFLYIFEGCILFDLIVFIQRTSGYDDLFFTRIGMLFISSVMALSRFREILDMIRLGVQAGRIGKIAFTDANTGIGNAAAFKAKFDELDSHRSSYKYIGIIQFDVNNLKVINDTKGHEAGDLLIKTAAGIINRAFGTIGTCYRTGGDEFVAIIANEHAPIVAEEAIYKFNRAIDKFNDDPDKPFDLRIAHGVAYYENDKNGGMSLKNVHKLADERMYDNKKMLKSRYAKTPEEAVIR